MRQAYRRRGPGVLALFVTAAFILFSQYPSLAWAADATAPATQPDAAASDAAAPATPAGTPASGASASDSAAAAKVVCCKPGDQTPPTELVKEVPIGELHSPYPDYAALAKSDPNLVNQFRLPGCNECHGGNGGGGFCPALTQGVWFWGNTDDVLFRLVTLGSAGLAKAGFYRLQWSTVHAGMPTMGFAIKTSDQLWKILAFIRSINPPDSNPPQKVVAPQRTPINYDK
jgi:mono/diheme cytochrome c family protein